MNNIPFHDFSDEGDPHFYCLATCEGIYQPDRTAAPVTAALYFSPSKGFARFCVQMINREGRRHLYHRGPDYSTSPEAVLLDAWCNFNIAPWNWFIFDMAAAVDLANAEHEALYLQARKELAQAMYWSRDLRNLGFFGPPAEEFRKRSADLFAPENSELLWAAVELDPDKEDST